MTNPARAPARIENHPGFGRKTGLRWGVILGLTALLGAVLTLFSAH